MFPNSAAWSRRPFPSIVQPGVSAIGYHQRSTQRPRRSESLTGLPSWSGSVKSGVSVPGCSIPETLDRRLLEDVHRACRAETDHVRQADLGVLDLAVAGLAPQVRRDFVEVCDAGCAEEVALRDEATRRVDGRLTVAPGTALVDELARLTRLAQSEVVVVDELGRREAVVKLDEVEVGRVDAGRLVR